MPFASHLAMSIGFFAGIIPSVFITFMTLKEYDEYYEDKHFFFLMVVGLFAGILVSLLFYWSIIYMAVNFFILVLLAIIIGFAIVEMLLFTIILSMKRFGVKYDLTYYGVVLGGSIAAILGMFLIYVYLRNNDLNVTSVISILLMVPTLPFLYISLGALIGTGLHKNEFFSYAIKMVVIKSIFNVIFIIWMIAFFYWPESGWDMMLIGLFFASIMYFYTISDVLPKVLPERMQKHKRRSKRIRRRK